MPGTEGVGVQQVQQWDLGGDLGGERHALSSVSLSDGNSCSKGVSASAEDPQRDCNSSSLRGLWKCIFVLLLLLLKMFLYRL